MLQPRFLTKSRFALAAQCPTKLFYTDKKEYANRQIEDPFLAALADGGFQVAELARLYHPGGIRVETLDYENALAQTEALLARRNVTIYEAALRAGNLFARVDILEKDGDTVTIHEVKAKSFDSSKPRPFCSKKGTIASGWREYLYDVAFQKLVAQKALPKARVSACLALVDTHVRCATDGLNQKFFIARGADGRAVVTVSPDLTPDDLRVPLVQSVNVDHECELAFAEEVAGQRFDKAAQFFAARYAADEKIPAALSSACRDCEFHATDEELAQGLRCGFRECWQAALKWKDKDFAEPSVLAIWDYRNKDSLIADGRVKMAQVREADIGPKADGKPGLSRTERQWLQVRKAQKHDTRPWLDRKGLQAHYEQWKFPLHFIDFETAMVAIPFNKGRRPYEGIAFQFSHHVVDRKLNVAHKGQYLDCRQGVFPNYDFVRALMRELEGDQGTIFRYASHENTYLNLVYRQLDDDPSPPADRDKLQTFIRSITHSVKESDEQWEGERCMVDLWQLEKRHYYSPAAGGSNSIKSVLPAVLADSAWLRRKYSQPIYGAPGGIPSLNFRNWTWLKTADGEVQDPYLLLPKLFQDASPHDLRRLLSVSDELHEGGAAMAAYARMQFTQMSDYEREELKKALLKYCELDTLAMVMIYEGWREML